MDRVEFSMCSVKAHCLESFLTIKQGEEVFFTRGLSVFPPPSTLNIVRAYARGLLIIVNPESVRGAAEIKNGFREALKKMSGKKHKGHCLNKKYF